MSDREMQLLWPIIFQTIHEFSTLSDARDAIHIGDVVVLFYPNLLRFSIRPISILFRPISHMGGTARPNGLNKPSLVCLAQLRIRKWSCIREKEQQKYVEEGLYIIEVRVPAAPKDVVGNVRKGSLVYWLVNSDGKLVEYVQFGALL